MKGKYSIRSRFGDTYQSAYAGLLLPLLSLIKEGKETSSFFNQEYNKLAKGTLRKFNAFCMVEPYRWNSLDEEKDAHDDANNLLIDMLPVLHLRGSDELKTKMSSLGLYKQVRDHFIVKKILDQKINKLGKKLSLPDEAIDNIKILCYLISFLKCKFYIEDALGKVYESPNERRIISTKHQAEKIKRKIRDKGELPVDGLSINDQRILKSDLVKNYISSGNILAGQNKTGEFNITFLARIIFMIVKFYALPIRSDRHLLRLLFPVFSYLYSEKNFYNSSEEWNAYKDHSTNDKKPGYKYENYMELKVKVIVDYNRLSEFLTLDSIYNNPSPEIGLDEALEAFMNWTFSQADYSDRDKKQ